MSFHPPLPKHGAKDKPSVPKAWYEELMEKDEILLYITALLGVILPGLVYFIYHKVHKIYMVYAMKKEALRQAEDAARAEVAVISLGSSTGFVGKCSNQLFTLLKEEMINEPKMWAVKDMKSRDFADFKGLCIFLAETEAGGVTPSDCEWFLDWMEDIAADQKQRKKTNIGETRFAIAGFGSGLDGEMKFNKVARTLLKRLKILGSKQLLNVELFDTDLGDTNNEPRFTMFMGQLLEAMDSQLNEDEETATESEFEESEDERQSRDKKRM